MKSIISSFYRFVVSWLSLFTDKITDGLILNYIYLSLSLQYRQKEDQAGKIAESFRC